VSAVVDGTLTPVRIGIFGGSFDPVHLGHLIVAQEAAGRLALDQVRLVVAGRQPLKRRGHVAAAADRLAMLSLAVAGDPRLVADGRELDRPGPSYTIDTLRELGREQPGAALCLLVGADAAGDFPQWREAETIPSLATVVVLTRPGMTVPDHLLIGETLEVPAIDISATVVRARCRRGESIRYLVPDAVARYIAERQLYTEGD
jgi:nicotinate-nucleotide adenylyltransferase